MHYAPSKPNRGPTVAPAPAKPPPARRGQVRTPAQARAERQAEAGGKKRLLEGVLKGPGGAPLKNWPFRLKKQGTALTRPTLGGRSSNECKGELWFTDHEGRYRFADVADTEYAVEVVLPGARLLPFLEPAGIVESGHRSETPAPPPTERVATPPAHGHVLEGVLQGPGGRPLRRWPFRLRRDGQELAPEAVGGRTENTHEGALWFTDAEGRYRFEGVAEGDWAVDVVLPGLRLARFEEPKDAVDPGHRSETPAPQLAPRIATPPAHEDHPQERHEKHHEQSHAPTLRGFLLLDEDGRPLDRQQVVVRPARGPVLRTTTDDAGYLQLAQPLGPGRHEFCLQKKDGAPLAPNAGEQAAARWCAEGRVFTCLQVQVFDKSGSLQEKAKVLVDHSGGAQEQKTDARGRVIVDLKNPDAFLVTVSGERLPEGSRYRVVLSRPQPRAQPKQHSGKAGYVSHAHFQVGGQPFAKWFNEKFFPSDAHNPKQGKSRLLPNPIRKEDKFLLAFDEPRELLGLDELPLNEFVMYFVHVHIETGGLFEPHSERGTDKYFFEAGVKKSYNGLDAGKGGNRFAGDQLKARGVLSDEEDVEAWNSTRTYPAEPPSSRHTAEEWARIRERARDCDFYRFRGRGLCQITNRANYKKFALPFVQGHPDCAGKGIDELTNAQLDNAFKEPSVYLGCFRSYHQALRGVSGNFMRKANQAEPDFRPFHAAFSGSKEDAAHDKFHDRCVALLTAMHAAGVDTGGQQQAA